MASDLADQMPPSWQELAETFAGQRDDARQSLTEAEANLLAERDSLTARLAEAEKVVERVLGRHGTIGTLCEADEYELRRWYDKSTRAETTDGH